MKSLDAGRAVRISRTLLAAVALAVLPGTARAAIAADPAAAPASSQSHGTAAKDSKHGVRTSYCIMSTFTGSRIPQKVCKTRAEWSAEGVEIPEDGRS